MSILTPGFSERVFEFSFNAEYAHRNKAVLAGAPHIPTQNAEKWLGYDVAFEVKRRGGAVHSVALQHKVSRYVDKLGPKNGHFWTAAGGPYFAFRLDTFQYNLIQSIASSGLAGINFYFCAPIFASRKAMDTHYLAKTVETSSIWIDVKKGGQITDGDMHTIIYAKSGLSAFRFSEKGVQLEVTGVEARSAASAERKALSLEEIEPIYEAAFTTLHDHWPQRRKVKVVSEEDALRMPAKLPERKAPTAANTGKLLGQYFGVSLLMEVRK